MNFDILIAGGGMAGQALALSLAHTQLKIGVIEFNDPNPVLDQQFHTRVSAITPKSEQLLSEIGAWPYIARKKAFVKTRVWDQNSHGHLDFDGSDQNLARLGHIIENDAIQSALFQALEPTKVEFIQARFSHFDKQADGYVVHLDDGKQLSTKLLIGADGARSKVRELAGIDYSEHDYEQQAIVCNIQCEKSFEDTTWQRFLSDSIIALLPLGEHMASIVWSAKNPLASELMSLDKSEFADRLSQGVEYRFSRFEVISDIQAFPLIERSSRSYVKENLALIGDAAHNIHPLAGQGINLGFADVIELSAQIKANIANFSDYSVLRKYARARRLDNELMAKTMTGLNWIYKENSEPMRLLRGVGMNLVNEVPMLKSFFQKHALGES